jgi:hypothetical protein
LIGKICLRYLRRVTKGKEIVEELRTSAEELLDRDRLLAVVASEKVKHSKVGDNLCRH